MTIDVWYCCALSLIFSINSKPDLPLESLRIISVTTALGFLASNNCIASSNDAGMIACQPASCSYFVLETRVSTGSLSFKRRSMFFSVIVSFIELFLQKVSQLASLYLALGLVCGAR